ncbi:CRAL/TRIO domain containing protein [Novymonas esmeraldas]|uniref:CRAL/TRIO domain containing protein n=1 Tax=Novymonas esmeraldas TaxID=1808958 RepID=A0AAW0EWN3_9TRYP
MTSLDACREQYEKDLANQTHCSVLEQLTAEHKAANRKVFEQLLRYQQEINAKGTLPYQPDPTEEQKKKSKDTTPVYPENITVRDPRQLKQILPIPDVHKLSDCDVIYRFLIGRRMDVQLTTTDVLHYIAFREKYSLDTILWDREVEATFNGLDGEELVQQVMAEMKKSNATSAAKVKITRPLLQAGWAAWNCGVDKRGHVVFYQRPNPKELAMLEKRWPYVEGNYDCRNPDFHSVTAPYSNLLARVYLRVMEKGRRISRLLNFNQQHIIREGLHVKTSVTPTSADTFMDNGGGATCLVDVGCVKVSHLTSSKCKKAFKLFRILSMMGQSFYPENMTRMIVVNGGFVFNMLFKLVRPWLDPQTQKKIVLLSATNKASLDELSSDSSHTSPNHAAHNSDDSDDDAASSTPAGTEADKANFALREALAEYIHEDFIPSWYGGRLPVVDSPLFYGGAPPKSLVSNPHYVAACERLRARVLPELLPDSFILSNAEEGEPVSKEEWKSFCEHSHAILFRK